MLDVEDGLALLTAGTIVAVLLVASPALGVVDLTAPPRSSELGDGTATVGAVDVPVSAVAVTNGRFGTEAYYLRLPDASVDVTSVSGTPRIVYRVQFRGLDVDLSRTRLLDDPGRTTIPMADRALPTDGVDGGRYVGSVTVRIQSFEVDETVYRHRVVVEVPADG